MSKYADTSELRFGSVQNLYLELETLPLTELFRSHKFNVNGCPAFPPGEGPSKKKAKENAGKPVASYLLDTGPKILVKPAGAIPGK